MLRYRPIFLAACLAMTGNADSAPTAPMPSALQAPSEIDRWASSLIKAADGFCGEIKEDTIGASAATGGNLDAKLNKLVKKLADVGIKINGSFTADVRHGVPQSDMAKDRADNRVCRTFIAQSLEAHWERTSNQIPPAVKAQIKQTHAVAKVAAPDCSQAQSGKFEVFGDLVQHVVVQGPPRSFNVDGKPAANGIVQSFPANCGDGCRLDQTDRRSFALTFDPADYKVSGLQASPIAGSGPNDQLGFNAAPSLDSADPGRRTLIVESRNGHPTSYRLVFSGSYEEARRQPKSVLSTTPVRPGSVATIFVPKQADAYVMLSWPGGHFAWRQEQPDSPELGQVWSLVGRPIPVGDELLLNAIYEPRCYRR